MISENYVSQIAGMIGTTISESASAFKIVDDSDLDKMMGDAFSGEITFTGPGGKYAFEFYFPNGRMHGEEIESWELFNITDGKSVKIGSSNAAEMSDEADAAAQFGYEHVNYGEATKT